MIQLIIGIVIGLIIGISIADIAWNKSQLLKKFNNAMRKLQTPNQAKPKPKTTHKPEYYYR